MDRSLDSIGSCSLDVDADSSDISDTSGSLNFPTPLSVKDITREFTANIKERCTLRSPQQQQQQHQQLQQQQQQQQHSNNLIADAAEKKPSYLNLACCVNGYSNLTTYDSKIRQDINKSREVSPIRPSTSSLQYCKRNNQLAAPVLHTMPLTKQPATTAMASKYNETNNNGNSSSKNGHLENGDLAYCNGGEPSKSATATSSFIQQRVERLYGPGALAQGFYSPKKQSSSSAKQQQLHKHQLDSPSSTELSRKFKQLSPSKDYGEFRKKLQSNCTRSQSEQPVSKTNSSQAPMQNGDTDLPVFRHLSHEFRAQLPTVSPKRTVPRVSNGTDDDQVDYLKPASTEEYMSTTKIRTVGAGKDNGAEAQPSPAVSEESKTVVKDGNYFLKILKDEQIRLIALAAVAEKYIDALTNNPDITEDTFGLLRSAAGKARLLASQKMKQFEGLCHNNLNRSPEDAFPTTVDDLQGFWDMVYLQVTHVDSIFADIEKLKSNDWQHTAEPVVEVSTAPVKITKLNTKTGNSKAKGAGTGTAAALGPSSAVAAMKREAQRKQLLEMKRLRREQLAAAAKSQAACDDGANIGDTVNNTVKNSSDHSS
ncbi:transcription factor kayak isoform X2 [Drosophila navojoa]|uniref:transcription factor kayak isoform X2 n=1 Tax=Drosophila navojoa TaxID=7232 RepID=UPI000846DA6E|nr:transcription factor kayak isoform X2 [Drosophila navojoa]